MSSDIDIAPAATTVPGAFFYWPDNGFWSFQLLRLFSQAATGGADLTEVHLAVRGLSPGDVDGWYHAFTALATRVERAGDEALTAGESVTARDAFKRASNYYRASGFFLRPDDQEYLDAVDARRRSFHKAIPLDDMNVSSVDIPYQDGDLPGYLISARTGGDDGRKPVVIVSGGADSVCEELYFAIGRGLAERGYHVLTFDGPGQGEALKRGFVSRADWELPTGAVIDFLETVPGVDRDRIGFVGQSLGGLYAVRVAAHERRLRSVVAWGAQWNIHSLFADWVRAGGPLIDHLSRWVPQMMGAPDLNSAVDKLKPFRADTDAALVSCPFLVMHGEADTVVPVDNARLLFDAIPRTDKQLKIFRFGEPGSEHCQVDSVHAAARVIGSWFKRTLG
ncbi:alpha/beta hydrolase family protein [Streptomyces sp. NPDC098781]|uniref:alpha/beta hydrolase family protein n=1 Tax=Streptomyces sp. NPDC098781 TaxID=3366097 RepID=UPI0038248AC4